jgi:hypothetical protein
LVLLLATVPGHTELGFTLVSATATSQTFTFAKPSTNVTICNYGANEIFYRLFWEGETPVAATTSFAQLVAGSATAPNCISIDKAPTNPAPWSAITIICSAAETATVHLLNE